MEYESKGDLTFGMLAGEPTHQSTFADRRKSNETPLRHELVRIHCAATTKATYTLATPVRATSNPTVFPSQHNVSGRQFECLSQKPTTSTAATTTRRSQKFPF